MKAAHSIRVSMLVALALLAGSCTGRHREIQPLTPSAPDYDRRVLEILLMHHQIEGEVLGLCALKASRAELKEFCRALQTAQAEESLRMRRDLKEWFGVERPSVPLPRRSITREYQSFLARIRDTSGPAFDEALLRGMRVHHRQGIREVRACEERAQHPVLRDYCRELNAAQQRDSQKLTEWICHWYKDCLGSWQRLGSTTTVDAATRR